MDLNLRPPIVTVLGHVDHGKTSLLDAIRKTKVTAGEAGGITQSIGATTVNNITFIDTPGHALFKNMRSRGVDLADIAILVVAADDGVQPQTKEAILLLQESKLPFVVAITKIDLPTANVETALQSLEKEGVYFEKRGGEISYIAISSKTGEGLPELLSLIGLLAEVHEIKGDKDGELKGFVVETVKDKRGLLASIVVKNGHIKIGETIYAGKTPGKIKGIFDQNQKALKEILPGFAGQVLGFNELPEAGSVIAGQPTEDRRHKEKSDESKEENLKIYLKARTTGSLEALLNNMPEGVQVVGSSVGDLTESDIFFAKSGNLPIYLFEAKFANSIKKLAETEDVKLYRFDIVYDLIDRLKEVLKEGVEEIQGEAQIVASFPFDKSRVAGCKIIQGVFRIGASAKLIRQDKEIGRVKIVTIRKQKTEVNEVKQGEECGILFVPQLDFQPNDVILSVKS